MNALAKRGAVKFLACAVIAVFTVIAIFHIWPAGFFRPMLYTVGGIVCCKLVWPTQDEGDALINSTK